MGRTYEESKNLFEQIKKKKAYMEVLETAENFFRHKVMLPLDKINSQSNSDDSQSMDSCE